MRESLLLKRLVAPVLLLGPEVAKQYGIANGNHVQVTSAAGSVTLAAKIDPTMQAGAVVAFDNLAAVSLAPVQTGPRTPVSIAKVEA